MGCSPRCPFQDTAIENSDTKTQSWHSDRIVRIQFAGFGQPELIIDPAQEWQCENRASISSQLLLPGIIGRSIWFLIGEKENRERSPAENPPS